MNTKLSALALAALLALAVGCSPSATPAEGATDEKTAVKNDQSQPTDDKTGAAQGAAELPEGVDPNGPLLTKPNEGEAPPTGPDGGKSDEMRNRMPGGNNPGGAGGGGGRRGGMGLTSLVRMEAVQNELKITDDQLKKIEDAIAKARENQDRQKAQEQLNKDLQATLSAAQYKRMQELNYQRMGSRALTRPEVVKELALSEDQVKKIEAALEVQMPQGGGNQGNEPGQRPSEEEMRKMWESFAKAREEANKKALAVLTPEQKAKYEKLLGKKFEFPQPQMSPGRGAMPAGGGA